MAASGMNQLRTDRLKVGYGGKAILHDVRLDLAGGSLVALLGRNGSGKTTLLRTLSAARAPLAGEVRWNGHSVHVLDADARARQVAVVLSQVPRCGALDVRTLVSFGRIPWTGRFGGLSGGDQEKVEKAMRDAGVHHLATRWVDELSDGERQRTMIARALAQDAPLLLMDEPLAHLDLVNRAQVMQLLQRIAHAGDRLVLYSTHDLALALELSDQVVLVQPDGHVWHGSTVEAMGHIAHAFSDDEVAFDPVTRGLMPRK